MLSTDELKKQLQGFFTDGLVTIIGSGLSCAEGLPSMGILADTLIEEVPGKCLQADLSQWQEIESHLRQDVALEDAINLVEISSDLRAVIVNVVAREVGDREIDAISDCISSGRKLKLSALLKYLSPKHPKEIQLITTNYDRLVEVACEMEGYWVNTGFSGKISGVFNPEVSRRQGAIGLDRSNGKRVRLMYPNMVWLSKPHGSLGWYATDGVVVDAPFHLLASPLIIAPGNDKYREGYEPPYDWHRDRGNRAIDVASALIFIGYGFNDDHLQTHIQGRLKAGIPALMLVRSLTPKAQEVVGLSERIIALSQGSNPERTLVTMQKYQQEIDGAIWDVENFVRKVLENE